MTSIRIRTKSSSSYLKATTLYNHQVLPPLMHMCQLNHIFLKSISADILETINLSVNKRVYVPTICKNAPYFSKSTSRDNPPILQTLYPILDSLDINTSTLKISIWVLSF